MRESGGSGGEECDGGARDGHCATTQWVIRVQTRNRRLAHNNVLFSPLLTASSKPVVYPLSIRPFASFRLIYDESLEEDAIY